MKIQIIAATILLIGLSTQQCQAGCLRCNNANTCVLCDITSNYYLASNTCVLSTQTNCALIAQSGNCVQCASGFYLDINSNRCLAVTTANQVPNCSAYNSAQVCTFCTGNFFIFGGRCATNNVTISNCNSYLGNGICNLCNSGFILSNDFTSCLVMPSQNNCLAYTFVGCKQCSAGYIVNPNNYFTTFITPTALNNYLVNIAQPTPSNWAALSVCQATTVANCLQFTAFNYCTQCAAGYYLQTGACFAFPLPVVDGCAVYTSLTVCSACVQGMYLSGNLCAYNTVIANCIVYNGAASTTTCSQCNSGYFLNGNVCQVRVNSLAINNCAIPSLVADVCGTCTQGFILTTDSRACLVAIANCATYPASTVQSNTLFCSVCLPGFYLVSTGSSATCVAGIVPNCQTYALASNTCTSCQFAFYLTNGACVAHVNIPNCLTYSQTTPNTCNSCVSGFYSFSYTTVCVQTNLISSCVAYAANGNSCTNCAAGFYVANGNCVTVPTAFSNCATFSGTVCTKCNTGYMVNQLAPVGACVLPLDYINASTNSPCSVLTPIASTVTPTWMAISTTVQSPITCQTCNNYMYSYTPQRAEAICVNNNQLVMYSVFTSVSNCKRYGLNYASPAVVVCMECNQGYFISGYQLLAQQTDATTCVSTCSPALTQSPAVFPDDMLGFVNICVPYSATGAIRTSGYCQRYARVASTYLVLQITTPGAQTLLSGLTTGLVDFQCVLPALSTTTIPTNYMVFTTPAVNSPIPLFFSYEIASASTQVTVSTDFTNGYSNSVGTTSITPTVFNYHGLLSTINDVQKAGGTQPTVTALGNNFSNCDILWVTGGAATNPEGSAYIAGVANYNPALVATTYTSCLRCQFGYQMSFSIATSFAANPPFPSCLQMTNCASSTTVYGGLPTYLNSIFSCHLCSQVSGQATYPTIWIDTDAVANAAPSVPGQYIGYTVTGVYTTFVSGTNGILQASHGFRCAAAQTGLLTVDAAAPTTVTSIANCAAYGVVSPVTAYATLSAVAGTVAGTRSICLACAGNSYPVYAQTTPSAPNGFLTNTKAPGWTVTACTSSLNCNPNIVSQFNSCGACRTDQENNTPAIYYGFMDFTLTNCYASITQNCFILSTTGFATTSAGNACSVCKAGFFKNADGYCEHYVVPNEASSGAIFVNSYYASQNYPSGTYSATPITGSGTTAYGSADLVNVRLHYLLSYNGQQYGVSGCSIGWVQAPANPWAPKVCLWSSYVYNFTGTYPSGTRFIQNCIRYNLTLSASGNQVCGGCNTGYIPLVDGSSCISNAALANCVFAQTGSGSALCYQCAANLVNINGACVSASIANCATYVNTQWSFSTPSILQCDTCIAGFVLSGDFLTCTAGNVLNCKTYKQGQPKVCTGCLANFGLLGNTTQTYCYPLPSSLNCLYSHANSLTSGGNAATISCAECASTATQVFGLRTFAQLGLNNAAQGLCMPFSTIANCLSYDQNNTQIALNSFGCAQCSPNFWYSSTNFSCIARVNMPTQCSTYSLTADVCTVCAAGSFLTTTGTQCVNFPTGIFGCSIYSSQNVCTRCNPGLFLINNKCAYSTVIANCAIYTANYTCAQCVSNFFLLNSTACVTPTALNCLTYTSISVCSSCASGWGLQTTNGVTSCVLVALPNCVNGTTVAPFTCLVCQNGYYPNTNGVCTLVSQTIPSCLVYDTATTCVTCNQGTILNVARTVCNSTFYSNLMDPNCQQSFLSSQPSCSQCALGSYFVNGTCTSCMNQTRASGCLSCDPLDNNSCFACAPGYYMNAQGLCIAINGQTPVNPTPTPTPNGTASASLASALAVSVGLVALNFWRF